MSPAYFKTWWGKKEKTMLDHILNPSQKSVSDTPLGLSSDITITCGCSDRVLNGSVASKRKGCVDELSPQ